ncbi:hypothetical protein ElyMa_006216200 [Elysia marginata]|uniref:Uncharacterized protein n=1 Tax=Elysia marginata TaxID=1093978 RepID=A0AAV4H6E6_9GAST|nr:hypothetical protein ElyMa_006216200 [Elysia marginata]
MTETPCFHNPRRRSRSVGDDPDSSAQTKDTSLDFLNTAQGKTRGFGVFDKRASRSSSNTQLHEIERGSQDTGISSPFEKTQLAKLPSQLVSECRKLGKFLRSLSSKSFSSSCEESLEPEEMGEAERNVSADERVKRDTTFIDKPETHETKASINTGKFDSSSGNKTVILNISNKFETMNFLKSARDVNIALTDEHKHCPEGCTSADLSHFKKNIQHLQSAIVSQNISSVYNENENRNTTHLETRVTLAQAEGSQDRQKGRYTGNLNFQVPIIKETGIMTQSPIENEEKLGVAHKESHKLTLKIESDCLSSAYNDGYATDVESSPFGCRTPIGQYEISKCSDSCYTGNANNDDKEPKHFIEANHQIVKTEQSKVSEIGKPYNKEKALDCPTFHHTAHNCIDSSFDHCYTKFSCSSENLDDEVSPEAEVKQLEKPKSYLQVLTPVLISSSADESDGMSPGNLSPCSWYTGSGVTSGESDGPGLMPVRQRLNVIALDRVCFAQGHSDGQMQLQKWVRSQQSRTTDSQSSNEDLLTYPQSSGRTSKNKQCNMALRKGNLPHIQVHTLRDGDVKTYRSDPNLPDVPNSPLSLVSDEQDNPRVRAFSDVSAMDNPRSCRYSDSVFSDTLRTPSIATPCLRTPSSGGGPSDYNTSTEVLFAPSDLADNSDCFFDTDSVFTPDNERKIFMKNKEFHLLKGEKSACSGGQNSKKRFDDESFSQSCNIVKRQRKRRSSVVSDRESQKISSSDSDSPKSIGSCHVSIFTSKGKENLSPPCSQQNLRLNHVKSMFNKIAQIFSPLPKEDVYQLLSDSECHQISDGVDLPEDDNVLEERRVSNDTTTSTSLTLSLVSPQNHSTDRKQSSSVCSIDDSSIEADNEVTINSKSGTKGTLEEDEKHAVPKNVGFQQLLGTDIERLLPNATHENCTGCEANTKNVSREEEEKFIPGKSFLQFLTEKWSNFFSSASSNYPQSNDVDLASLLPAAGLDAGSPCKNKKIDCASNLNLTGARRPESLDFSSKRSRVRSQRKMSIDKNYFNKGGVKQATRKVKKTQKQHQPERRLSLVAALNLLSEGASEESFTDRLDDSAVAAFAEMRRLNFTVREFPKSSIEIHNNRESACEKCLDMKEMSSLEHKDAVPIKDVLLNHENIEVQVPNSFNEKVNNVEEVQLLQNINRKVKQHGPRRRFSDSTATQRSRRAHGMVHLKPPNWTFGYSNTQENGKTSSSQNVGYSNKTNSGTKSEEQNETVLTESSLNITSGNCFSLPQTDIEKVTDEQMPEMQVYSDRNNADTYSIPDIDSSRRSKHNSTILDKQRNEIENSSVTSITEYCNPLNKTQKNQSNTSPKLPSPPTNTSQENHTTKSEFENHKRKKDLEIKLLNDHGKPIFPKRANSFEEAIDCHEAPAACTDVERQATRNVHQVSSFKSKKDTELKNRVESEPLSCGDKSLSRYYHVFKKDELEDLIKEFVPNLCVIDTFYDHSNWCIVAQKI